MTSAIRDFQFRERNNKCSTIPKSLFIGFPRERHICGYLTVVVAPMMVAIANSLSLRSPKSVG